MGGQRPKTATLFCIYLKTTELLNVRNVELKFLVNLHDQVVVILDHVVLLVETTFGDLFQE